MENGDEMRIIVDAAIEKKEIKDLFGIFFEDLNHAADGGLYGELVRNRSFEFAAVDHPDYHSLTAWEKLEGDGAVNLMIETGNPADPHNPHYLAMDIYRPGLDAGVQNVGWGSGIPLKEGCTYYFTCYARREQGRTEPITVSLRSQSGKVYETSEIIISDTWKKYELQLQSPATDNSARLAITARGSGKVYLDFVSLFPADTYKGRKNGVRRDIAELLEQMHPKFMRFPGGCLVHDGSLNPDDRDSMYRWKNTIGPVESRPARRNNWGYNQTLGLGFYELFLLSEDIGAKPLPVIAAGYDPHHKREVPLNEMQPWIDDALDLIEFANGSQETKWGSIRAEMGHPEPFHMEYLGIGNEEVGEGFFERFEIIYHAVRRKHPEIKVIGTSGPNAAGSEFERGWESGRRNGVEFVDEHYYQSPEWFLANHHRYDSYPGDGPKVFLGEYASWGNTWYNALTEASYMTGLERNAHAVGLACYAPLLAHIDYVNWKPDMIWYHNHKSYGTPNYYVQKMFMNHQGKYQLHHEMEDFPDNEILSDTERIAGRIILCDYESEVTYTDITLMNEDTKETMAFEDCRIDLDSGKEIILTETDCQNYTLCLKAVETEGYRGFRIRFGSKDSDNEYCWTLGGWQNQDTFIGEKINGKNSDLSQCLLTVEKNRTYDLRLEVRGRRIKTYVDNALYHDTESKPVIIEPLYFSAQESEKGGLIIKAVNVSEKAVKASICIRGMDALENKELEAVCMEGWEPDAVNSITSPDMVSPGIKKVKVTLPEFQFEFPGRSIYIFHTNG